MDIIRQTKQKFHAEQWKQILLEHQSSGLTIEDFCKEKGFSRSSFYKWQKIVRLDFCSNAPSIVNDSPVPPIVKLDQAIIPPPEPIVAPPIFIHMNGVKVEIPHGADPGSIKAILQVLTRVC